MNISEITVQQLQALKEAKADFFLLDVRDPEEYALGNLGGHLIPLKELPQRLNELNPKAHIIVHCQAGGRSRRATEFLMSQGFANVDNLQGGLNAWLSDIGKKA